MEGRTLRRYFFLALFIALLILVARLFSPFVTVILWSALLYALLLPVYEAVVRAKSPTPLAEPWRTVFAALLSIASVLLILVPIILLSMALVGQVREFSRSILEGIDAHQEIFDLSPNGPVGRFLHDLTQGDIDFSRIDLRGEVTRMIDGSALRILSLSTLLAKKLLLTVIGLLLAIFTLFFLFIDGKELQQLLLNVLPIEKEYSLLFLRTIKKSSKDLVVGYLLVSLIQGVIAGILFSTFHIKGALILGVLTIATSFVPMIGTATIWLPVSISVIAGGEMGRGLLLLGLSAVLIAGLDNILRIYLLRNRLKIHPLLIFFAIIGGIEAWGINGLILGPLTLSTLLAAARLYNRVTERDAGDHGRSDVEEEAGQASPRPGGS